MLLELDNVSLSYGRIQALHGISLTVGEGEVVALIGANGAGKSTTLRTISGLMKPRRGTIAFAGSRINGRPGNEIVSRGICHSPVGGRIFPNLTVDENLDLGAFLRNDRAAVAATRAHVLELFPRLAERINQKAGTMSGGEQQMLAVARAMMGKPKLLLLDEPSMGLAPVLVDLIFDTIERIRDEGTTVLLIEQNALAALRVADYAYVMESGRLKLEGPARALSEDEGIVNAYLGGG
jgi:branched-chain amino acid transport system ATP-binding protein